uniref:flagellar hook-basal body complex protein n=1 Tax=uncultured Spongiibacter sp. TaxID=870896 RepID=UPI002592DE93
MADMLGNALSALTSYQRALATTSHNIANANTQGFKKARVAFEDLLYQNLKQVGGQNSQQTLSPSGLQAGTGVRAVATEKIYTQGTLAQTGNQL